ncbi:hypothetical protein, partial [Rhizobium leguminosarum]|uniref:hypothetical protein n=1 Tax=Rhizobium leguminosarum TaxID=384 RepID=UPI001953EEE3
MGTSNRGCNAAEGSLAVAFVMVLTIHHRAGFSFRCSDYRPNCFATCSAPWRRQISVCRAQLRGVMMNNSCNLFDFDVEAYRAH